MRKKMKNKTKIEIRMSFATTKSLSLSKFFS